MNLTPNTTQVIFAPIEAGDIEAVTRLLDADPGLAHVKRTETDKEGQTPLQLAAMRGDLPLVRLLVERGAEVYDAAQWGYPAVAHAGFEKKQEVVDYFLQEIPDRAGFVTNNLGIEINLAGRLGWTDVVRRHIAKDRLSVHQRGSIGDYPLHWPAHNGHEEIVTLLLDAGADIEAEAGLYGGKPLHWAAEHAPGCVRLLIEHGANVDSRNSDDERRGFTPLIMCATQRNDCAECAELLLAAGADVHARDARNKTALDYALARGLTRVPVVLKRYGA